MPSNEPNRPWRSWYSEREWFRARTFVLKRDSVLVHGVMVPKCQKTGVLLTGPKDAPNSPIVDHIKAHKGDRALFFDRANMQTVSKQWHDSSKQRQEKGSRIAVGVDGWPVVERK